MLHSHVRIEPSKQNLLFASSQIIRRALTQFCRTCKPLRAPVIAASDPKYIYALPLKKVSKQPQNHL